MLPSLVYPEEMPVIDGIRIPVNLYVALKEPALLAGMSLPGKSTPWEKIGDTGFSADEVINYLDEINKERGFEEWPETEWQGEMIRRY